MSADEPFNLWSDEWDDDDVEVLQALRTDVPAVVPVWGGGAKTKAALELGHLKDMVDVQTPTNLANNTVGLPNDNTQHPVCKLAKGKRSRCILVKGENDEISAMPLTWEQDIDVVKALVGKDKYTPELQKMLLKCMVKASPEEAVARIEDEGLRELFSKAGNIIFGDATVTKLKPPRKRNPKKPPAAKGAPKEAAPKPQPPPAVADPPAPAAPAAPAEPVALAAPKPPAAAKPSLKKRPAPVDEAPPPAEKRFKVTITAEINSLSDLQTLLAGV